jgi:hypothetical protein
MTENFLLKIAKEYYELGLNISHIEPQTIELVNGRIEKTYKKPSFSLSYLSRERQSLEQIKGYNWGKVQ